MTTSVDWHTDRAEVTPGDVHAALDRIVLVDCRTEQERAIARIASSRHVGLDRFAEALDELVATAGPIVVHCHHGVRSLAAANALRRAGKSDVWSMQGGIDRWSCDVEPEVPRY